MFQTVADRLAQGVNIVIFPEGTCHSTYEIKELKSGTARMALGIAADGGTRVPIVPIGLSYSRMSGHEFRSNVLVDIGRPIEITDDLVALYTSGDPNDAHEAVNELTTRLERHLRHVTINSPNWADQLDWLVAQRGLPPPVYRVNTEARDNLISTHCVLRVGDTEFTSRTKVTSAGEADNAGRKLKQEAARVGYFTLSGAADSEAFHDSDWTLVDTIRLARRLYKPTDTELSLAQYAALTRSFVNVSIQRLNDPAFQKLYREIKEYDAEMRTLGISDQVSEPTAHLSHVPGRQY